MISAGPGWAFEVADARLALITRLCTLRPSRASAQAVKLFQAAALTPGTWTHGTTRAAVAAAGRDAPTVGDSEWAEYGASARRRLRLSEATVWEHMAASDPQLLLYDHTVRRGGMERCIDARLYGKHREGRYQQPARLYGRIRARANIFDGSPNQCPACGAAGSSTVHIISVCPCTKDARCRWLAGVGSDDYHIATSGGSRSFIKAVFNTRLPDGSKGDAMLRAIRFVAEAAGAAKLVARTSHRTRRSAL